MMLFKPETKYKEKKMAEITKKGRLNIQKFYFFSLHEHLYFFLINSSV